MSVPHIQLLDADDLPEYEIPSAMRLDSHHFIQWNWRRWELSNLRKAGYRDPEVGFFSRELIDMSYKMTPLGTLPCADEDIAFDLGLPLERWITLTKRNPSPLYNWYRVRCDNGEIRYGHKIVTLFVKEALSAKANNQAKTDAASREARLRRLTRDVGALWPKTAADPRQIVWIDNRIQERIAQRGGVRRTDADLHMAVQECMAEAQRGRFPEVKKR